MAKVRVRTPEESRDMLVAYVELGGNKVYIEHIQDTGVKVFVLYQDETRKVHLVNITELVCEHLPLQMSKGCAVMFTDNAHNDVTHKMGDHLMISLHGLTSVELDWRRVEEVEV